MDSSNAVDSQDHLEPIVYICAECGNDLAVQPTQTVRCRNCGSRILYKKRSHRVVQYEAR